MVDFIHNIVYNRFLKFLSHSLLSNIPFVKCIASDFYQRTFSFFGSNTFYGASYLKCFNSKDVYTADLIRFFRFQFGNVSPFEQFIFDISSA